MVKLGKVYQNLMVDVKATNEKLVDRACRIVMEATGAVRSQAEEALAQTGFEVKPAILMILADVTAAEAQQRLLQHQGYLRAALMR
jgi:N-acetylmuramic acid 6-phosphate etherase